MNGTRLTLPNDIGLVLAIPDAFETLSINGAINASTNEAPSGSTNGAAKITPITRFVTAFYFISVVFRAFLTNFS